MNTKFLIQIALLTIIGLSSCGDDEPTNQDLTLDITGLSNLGDDYAYEGWIMVDGTPQTTGVFTVDDNGVLSQNRFTIDTDDLASATAFILTIEPSPDNDPAPSDVHILAGEFAGNSANVTVSHQAAIGDDFTSSTGGFILATPTDNDDSNESSGVWFLDNTNAPPAVAGLDLPTLPTGWVYEGWAVINGAPISTGTFSDINSADDSDIYSGTNNGPNFPGEDFLVNAPAGQSFPTDLKSATIVISVEPVPDNSPAPFVLKPLVKEVEDDAPDHSLISMNNNANATNPKGSVSR